MVIAIGVKQKILIQPARFIVASLFLVVVGFLATPPTPSYAESASYMSENGQRRISGDIYSCRPRNVTGVAKEMRSCFVSNRKAAYFVVDNRPRNKASLLWRSGIDGTRPVRSNDPNLNHVSRVFAATDRFVYFTTWNLRTGEQALYRTDADGSDANTVKLLELGQRNEYDNNLLLYFLGTAGEDQYFQLTSSPGGENNALFPQFQVFRASDDEDGLIDLTNGRVENEHLHTTYDDDSIAVVGSNVYFASEGSWLTNLWRADKSGANAERIAEIRYDVGSLAETRLIAGESLVYLSVSLPTDRLYSDFSCTLWRSDGTPDGTFAINRAAADIERSECREGRSIAIGDTLLFLRMTNDKTQLWRSTGTRQSTRVLRRFSILSDQPDNPERLDESFNLAAFKGKVWFNTYDRKRRRILWRTDGTRGGTKQVYRWAGTATPESSVAVSRNRLLVGESRGRGNAPHPANPRKRQTTIYGFSGSGRGRQIVKTPGVLWQKPGYPGSSMAVVGDHVLYLVWRTSESVDLVEHDMRTNLSRTRLRVVRQE